MPKEEDDEHFILLGVPNGTVADVFDAHCRRLGELGDARGARPIPLVEDDLEKVVVYGQKLVYDRMKRRRMIASNPYDEATFDWSRPESSEPLVEVT